MERAPRTDNDGGSGSPTGGEDITNPAELNRKRVEDAFNSDPEGFYDKCDALGITADYGAFSDEDAARFAASLDSGAGANPVDSGAGVNPDAIAPQPAVPATPASAFGDGGNGATPVTPADPDRRRFGGELLDRLGKNKKIAAAAIVTAIASSTTLTALGIGGLATALAKKGDQGSPDATKATETVPTDTSAYGTTAETTADSQGTGETTAEATAGSHGAGEAAAGYQGAGDTQENAETQERLQFTNNLEYFWDPVKRSAEDPRIPGAFARAERLVGESYFEDLTEEERRIILDGDKSSEEYKNVEKKLFADSVMRECVDSRHVTASLVFDIEKVAPGTFKDFGFSGKTWQEIDKAIMEMDDDKAADLLALVQSILNGDETKIEETTIRGDYDNWREEDVVDADGVSHHVELVPMHSNYKDGMPVTKVTLPNGGVFYARILVSNIKINYDGGEEPVFICQDEKGNVYYGCGQFLLPVGSRPDGGDDDPENPDGPGDDGGEEKNADAARHNAGDIVKPDSSGDKTTEPDSEKHYDSDTNSGSGTEKHDDKSDSGSGDTATGGVSSDTATSDKPAQSHDEAIKDSDQSHSGDMHGGTSGGGSGGGGGTKPDNAGQAAANERTKTDDAEGDAAANKPATMDDI